MPTPTQCARAGRALNRSLCGLAVGMQRNGGTGCTEVYAVDFERYGPKRQKFLDMYLLRVLLVRSGTGDAYASDGFLLIGPVPGWASAIPDTAPQLGTVLPLDRSDWVKVTVADSDANRRCYRLSSGHGINPVRLAAARAWIGDPECAMRQRPNDGLAPIVLEGNDRIAIILPVRVY